MQRRPRMPFPKPLAEFFRESLQGTALGDRLRDADIWRVWPKVVGPAIASRAMPVRIINKTLTIAVSNGPWMQELSFLKEMIKEKLNLTLEDEIVREIILRAGKVAKPSVYADEAAPLKVELTDDQLGRIEQEASSIQDEETRGAFIELMKTSLQTRRTTAVTPKSAIHG